MSHDRLVVPSQIPDEGFTTNRYQVAESVTGIVSYLWFRQWEEARRSGDRVAEAEAEKAMATSRHWPILREMAKNGAYPNTIRQLAKEMPSGYWIWQGHRRPLLPRAEGLRTNARPAVKAKERAPCLCGAPAPRPPRHRQVDWREAPP